MKIPIIVAFPMALLTLSLALGADENKEVPNLAQGASVTARDSWVSKTPGVISRKDSYRIRTLEFDHEQSIEGYTFSSIAMVFDSDKLTTINFGGSLRESLPMKKGNIKLSCNGQALVKQGESEVPVLLYAPDEDNPFPRFVGSTINDENTASGWITITDSQQKQLKLPLLEFRIGETLVRCVIAEESSMNSTTNASPKSEAAAPNVIPGAFVGKWVALDNKDHYVLVTADDIDGHGALSTALTSSLPRNRQSPRTNNPFRSQFDQMRLRWSAVNS